MSKHELNIPEEFILMILNEQTGYFYQVSGWNFNCAIIGAVLADLSLKLRIDTDLNELHMLDSSDTGDEVLDLCLKQIANDPDPHNAQYWVERLTVHAERIIDTSLARLVKLGILTYHEGEFYSLNYSKWHSEKHGYSDTISAGEFIKSRVSEVIFTDVIPTPRDALIVNLLNACDVIRFIYQIDEEIERRIELVCNMELISRVISLAVKQNITSPSLKRRSLKRKVPAVSVAKLPFHQHFWDGHIPALMANLFKEYGPVIQMRAPFHQPMMFIGGKEVNQWVHRNGRSYLTSGNYFRELEYECGASGLITSLDGADHFRMRKVMNGVYSRAKFFERLEDMYRLTRQYMTEAKWQKGTEISVCTATRLMINLQMTELIVSTNTQDLFLELVKWKERASNVHVGHLLPKFMARTPAMKRRLAIFDTMLQRIAQNHTPYQRAGATRELADDLISLHASDPQFLPEQNIKFMLVAAPVLQSIYLGDCLGFALYEISRRPELAARIRREAHELFEGGDPEKDRFSSSAFDVTRRFTMECLRLYPVVSMQARHVANACVVENHELPLGGLVLIAQTATHYMPDVFPDPYEFDIDRYLPPREEHRGIGYAPYGLGSHLCIGFKWMEMQLIVTLLIISHYFEFAPPAKNYKLKINPFPTMSVSKKLKLRINKQLNELPV